MAYDWNATIEGLRRVGVDFDVVSEHEIVLHTQRGYDLTMRFLDPEHRYVENVLTCRTCGVRVYGHAVEIPRDESQNRQVQHAMLSSQAGIDAWAKHLESCSGAA